MVLHGQAFSLYEGPIAFWELFYKRVLICCCRWHGPAPEPEHCSSTTGASYELRMTCCALTNSSKAVDYSKLYGPSITAVCTTAKMYIRACTLRTWQTFITPSIGVRSISQLENTTFRISLNINRSEPVRCNVSSFTLETISCYISINRTLRCLLIIKLLTLYRVYLPHSAACMSYQGFHLTNYLI